MYYPEGMKDRVSPVQWSKPYSILAPLRIRTRAAGFKIISGDHYTTTAHMLFLFFSVGSPAFLVPYFHQCFQTSWFGNIIISDLFKKSGSFHHMKLQSMISIISRILFHPPFIRLQLFSKTADRLCIAWHLIHCGPLMYVAPFIQLFFFSDVGLVIH